MNKDSMDFLEKGLVLDSRWLFEKQGMVNRIEHDLANAISMREKNKFSGVDLRQEVIQYINEVEKTLKILEDSKRKAMAYEELRLKEIFSLLDTYKKSKSNALKKELSNLLANIENNESLL